MHPGVAKIATAPSGWFARIVFGITARVSVEVNAELASRVVAIILKRPGCAKLAIDRAPTFEDSHIPLGQGRRLLTLACANTNATSHINEVQNIDTVCFTTFMLVVGWPSQ
jgi:hypothetical protein